MSMNCEHMFNHKSKYRGSSFEEENGWTCDLNMKHCPLAYDEWPALCPAMKKTGILDTGAVMDGELKFLMKAGNGDLLDPEDLSPIPWDKSKSLTENIKDYYEKGLIKCAKDRDRLHAIIGRNIDLRVAAEEKNRKLGEEIARLRLALAIAGITDEVKLCAEGECHAE